jgi:hypothetical protein
MSESERSNNWCRRATRLGKRLRRTARKFTLIRDQYPGQIESLHDSAEQMIDAYEGERDRYPTDKYKARVDMCFNPLLEGKIEFQAARAAHQHGGRRTRRNRWRRTHRR